MTSSILDDGGGGEHDPHPPEWTELMEGKQWSRLLYSNPVCFLTTIDAAATSTTTKTTNTSSLPDHGHGKPQAESSQHELAKNVMVVSWLTATNNNGGLVLSINKQRCSTNRILQTQQFALCVPTRDMEDLVRQVGSVSGRWGISKFPDDHPTRPHSSRREEGEQSRTPTTNETMSHNRKKRCKPRYPNGIAGLGAVKLGTNECASSDFACHSSSPSSPPTMPFAIQGTAAHLQCRVTSHLLNVIDDEHVLVLAQVKRAWVQTNYWDSKRNLFRPCTSTTSPYLTFLGSRTFGYVAVSHKNDAAPDVTGLNVCEDDT